jgi:hypothetical protein
VVGRFALRGAVMGLHCDQGHYQLMMADIVVVGVRLKDRV